MYLDVCIYIYINNWYLQVQLNTTDSYTYVIHMWTNQYIYIYNRYTYVSYISIYIYVHICIYTAQLSIYSNIFKYYYFISQTVSHYQRVYQFIDAFPTQNCANSNRASSFGGRASTTMKLSRPYLRQQDLCEDQFGLGRKLQVSIGSLDILDDNWSPRNPNCFFTLIGDMVIVYWDALLTLTS